MRKLLFSILLCAAAINSFAQQEKKFNDTALLQPVEVIAVRAADKAPFAKTNLSKAAIEKNNLGQDLPFLLNQTASVVVNSDAGTGVGYTNIRIRGTDASRINVTLNGIPYNDAESQGTFFVDLPDFSSSANSIQVQRGVGTSTNGAGSFGGTINISTNEVNKEFYAAMNNSYGSYNTIKNNFQFGSGLLGKHFTIDGRLSNITSDGYIDRATSDLKSAYLSTAYTDAVNSLRFNFFTGKERTYQAWNGVPENLLNSDRTFNPSGMDQPYKPYENEVDNYNQTHHQLFYNHAFNSDWKMNVALFITHGKGYYEEYRAAQKYADYGLPDFNNGSSTVTKTDLVKRLWLNNNLYGGIFSAQYKKNNSQFIVGGGWNQYDGLHYGEIIWSKVFNSIPANYQWYNNKGNKTDFSLYTKWTEQWNPHWQSFLDFQLRTINYTINGFKDNPDLLIDNNYAFFNPKFGITYTYNSWQAYASYALATHEPNRDDFEAAGNEQPKPELLNDIEVGVQKKKSNYSLDANFFYMNYHNQLVLTGKINDVGAYTRTNIPTSYRMGIELQGSVVITNWINAAANISFSENKIKNFTEYLDDYDNGGQQTNFYSKTDIAFSPNTVAGATVNFIPLKNSEISFISKYVGRQYLDNTSKTSRSLNPFFVQDVRLSYKINKLFKETNVILQLNNIFSKKYEPNGYSYSYISGGTVNTENYYFPMAPRNFMIGVNVRL
ncbi:MAG: TonB-dependent receptor plug domain-containing protein [Ferruginibacter sp.]